MYINCSYWDTAAKLKLKNDLLHENVHLQHIAHSTIRGHADKCGSGRRGYAPAADWCP